MVTDQQLPAGLALNAETVIGISFGKLMGNLVGTGIRQSRYPRVSASLALFRNERRQPPLKIFRANSRKLPYTM
ncbi:DUF2000 domain-containing protein [Pantoea sp. Taur]|nr:DUF2000 domain-containing protein [Pantoea sp. Taur]